MSSTPEPPITLLLQRVRGEETAAIDTLFGMVYGELRGMARGALRGDANKHTLQPTALVHEVWMKLAGSLKDVSGRSHFLAIAARAMRQVLQDHAHAKKAVKRGGLAARIELVEEPSANNPYGMDLLVLDDLLTKLAGCNPRHAEVVQLRVLGGMKVTEVSEVLGVSQRTVELDWQMARAWLRKQLSDAG